MTTQHLADHSPETRTLRALFELGRLDCTATTVSALAGALGLRATEVARALIALEQRGLVRADHVRLTLLGLGVATRLPTLALSAPVAAEKPRVPVVVRGLANARPQRVGARRVAQLPRAACH